MSDTDPARIGDVKGGLEAAREDTSTRLKRDGSNVEMTTEQATTFRAAIGGPITQAEADERYLQEAPVTSVAGRTGAIDASSLKTALTLVKADVGLNNVNNTADANKPISNSTQTALDAKLTAPNMAALKPPEFFTVAVSDEVTAITTGTAKVTFRMPYGFTLTGVRASLSTASTSGLPQVAIKEGGASILSTNITIDANEKTSTTAVTPAVISDAFLADDAEITIDIVAAGTGAKGLKVTFLGSRT